MCVGKRKGPAGARIPRDPAHRKDVTVDKKSLAHPARTVRVDHALLEEIAELTGIEYRVLSSAFAGEEKDLALDVVKTALTENPQGTPEEWQEHMLAWVKENGSGEYRWRTYLAKGLRLETLGAALLPLFTENLYSETVRKGVEATLGP